MSKTPKDKSPRNVASRTNPQADEGDLYDDYYDDEPEYVPPPPRQTRSAAQQQQDQIRSRQRAQDYRPRSVQPQRRIGGGYTIFLGVLVALILVGAIAIAYLLGSRSGSNTSAGNQQVVAAPTTASNTSSQPNQTYPEVPRIEIADFIKLYSDMSKHPYLIDVRPKDQYDQEHIKDAISFPTNQLAALAGQLPKDKLIVAYCA